MKLSVLIQLTLTELCVSGTRLDTEEPTKSKIKDFFLLELTFQKV